MMKRITNERCGLVNSKTWHRLYDDAISMPAVQAKQILQWILEQDEFKKLKKIYFCCADENYIPLLLILVKHFSQKNIECHVYGAPELKNMLDDSVLWISELPYDLNNSLLFDLVCGYPFNKLKMHQVEMIRCINQANASIVSLECPAGLNPDTGGMNGKEMCKAHFTLSTFAYLQGLWTGLGKTYTGKKVLLHRENKKTIKFSSWLMSSEQMKDFWPHRNEFAHKGCFKKVICISGQMNMFGATLLAAKAALLMGAGLIEVYHPQNIPIPYAEYPEVIWHPIGAVSQIPFESYSDAIWIIGPGLGLDAWALSVWREVVKYDYRMVVDASALRWLSSISTKNKNWIITPHPGEAAELLGISPAEVQNNRFQSIVQLQQQTHMTVILKGSGTLVMGNKNHIEICPHGHAGMASPGMGDVLTGIIAGLYAQIDEPTQASILAVWIHAVAGDRVHPIVTASHLLHELQFHLQDVLCT